MDWSASLLSFLASVTLRSLCLVALALAAVLAFRMKAAAARHAVFTVATIGMLLLAVLNPLLPRIPLRVPQAAPIVDESQILDQPLGQAVGQVSDLPTPAGQAGGLPYKAGWEEAAAALYLLGVLAFLTRLAFSYLFTVRLVRASHPVEDGMYESTWLSVPMTVGCLRPKILLSADWRTWDSAKLQAVLVHERTHIERADWLISILAGFNRCLFWFNPLTWWLERRLATLAEEACDDAALLQVNSGHYAQALLDMAAAVKTGQGRLIWEAMAMAKAAEVQKRIERVLDETRQIPRALTRARWAALAACSLPLIYTAAVVQLVAQEAPRTPAAMSEFLKGRRQLTAADASMMEQYLIANSHDLDARSQLVVYYFANGVREQRMGHILWLIANHPESNQAVFTSQGVSPRTNPLNDATDYARAAGLWRQQAAAKANDPRILANAAQFFGQPGGDFDEAESLLLRARSIEPNNMVWGERLGKLYASAILGATGDSRFFNSNPKMADRMKLELENTQDGWLAFYTGSALTAVARRPTSTEPLAPGVLNLDDHPMLVPAVDLGQRLLARAKELGVSLPGILSSLPPGSVLRMGKSAGPNPPRTQTPEEAERTRAFLEEQNRTFAAIPAAPQPLTRTDPVYPPLARQARISGEVRLYITIGADGHVSQLEVFSGHPLLVPASLEAVKQWTFPVGTQGKYGLRMPFTLTGADAPQGIIGSIPGGVPNGVVGGMLAPGVVGGVAGGVPGGVSGTPQRIRVGANVQAARLTNKVDPVYPPLARQTGIDGAVRLQVTIGKDGSVESTETISGHPLLVGAAIEAVKQWTYQPTLLNGEPVQIVTQVTIPFELSQ